MAPVDGDGAGEEALVLGDPVDAPEVVWTRVISRALDPVAEPVDAELVPDDLTPGQDEPLDDGVAHEDAELAEDQPSDTENLWDTGVSGSDEHPDQNDGGFGHASDDSWNG